MIAEAIIRQTPPDRRIQEIEIALEFARASARYGAMHEAADIAERTRGKGGKAIATRIRKAIGDT
jgi:hypothetical protein